MSKISYWQDSEKKQLRTLFDQGKAPAEIASALNRTDQAVRNQCKHAGLSFRDRDRKTVIKKQKPATGGEIPCLRCRLNFKSEGIFNRICPNCARLNAGYVGVVPG